MERKGGIEMTEKPTDYIYLDPDSIRKRVFVFNGKEYGLKTKKFAKEFLKEIKRNSND